MTPPADPNDPHRDASADAPSDAAAPNTEADTGAEASAAGEAETAATEQTGPSEPVNPRVRIETSAGTLLIELLEDVAPRTVAHFLQLVHDGFYDGRTFHRVIPDFIIQGGCPYHDGTGGCGYTIDPEFNDTPHEKGTVSMARTADPYSASSQFFICLSRDNCQHLDGEYTAFGKVVDGLHTLDELAATPLTNYELGTPSDPPMLYHVYREDDPNAHYYD